MKIIFTTFIITFVCCKSPSKSVIKNNNFTNKTDTAVVVLNIKDSIDLLPSFIKELIEKMKNKPVTNPPSKVLKYTLNNKTVFYIPPVCCDNFSDLYDDSCKIIAHPDGGFTGKGDGKLPHFEKEKLNEKLIWIDTRK